MSYSEEPEKKKWFNKHPLVATVLWALGTHTSKKEFEDAAEESDRSTLTWKDDHGGHIAEYFEKVQTTDITEDTSHSGQSVVLKIGTESRADNKTPSVDNEDTSVSPQSWGFYVSITPPQEQYSKGK